MFVSSNSLILSSRWSALFLKLSNAFFILITRFFSLRISFCFFLRVTISLVQYFCSLLLFMSSLNSTSEISGSLPSFFMTDTVNFLSVKLDHNLHCLCQWHCHVLVIAYTSEIAVSFCCWCHWVMGVATVPGTLSLEHHCSSWSSQVTSTAAAAAESSKLLQFPKPLDSEIAIDPEAYGHSS